MNRWEDCEASSSFPRSVEPSEGKNESACDSPDYTSVREKQTGFKRALDKFGDIEPADHPSSLKAEGKVPTSCVRRC